MARIAEPLPAFSAIFLAPANVPPVAVQEVAFTLGDGIAYVEAAVKALRDGQHFEDGQRGAGQLQ